MDLIEKSGSIAVFLMPSWVKSWLGSPGKYHKPLILAAWNGNELAGIFPMAVKTIGSFPFSIKKIEFAGRDEGDYLDFILDPGFRDICIETFLSFLRKNKTDWDVCDLNDFSQESRNYDLV